MKIGGKNVGASSTVILIVIVLVAISLAGGIYLWSLNQTPSLQEAPERQIEEIVVPPEGTLSPVPIYAKPIPPGEQTYFVSGKFSGPTISKVTINPQDAEAGEIQKITVEVSDVNPVTRVYVTVKLDTKSNTFDLALVSGTATQGVWEGEAPFPDDTLFTNYTITEVAVSATGTSTTTTTIR